LVSLPACLLDEEERAPLLETFDGEQIKPYFIEAGKKLTYGNLRRQMTDRLEDKEFPELSF